MKNARKWHTRCARWWNETHSENTLNTLWTHSENTLNISWTHPEDMPKIWQNLKNINDSVTDWPSNIDSRDASASKNINYLIMWNILISEILTFAANRDQLRHFLNSIVIFHTPSTCGWCGKLRYRSQINMFHIIR